MRDGFLNCAPRKFRVVEVSTADRHGPWTLDGGEAPKDMARIVLQGEGGGSFLTLEVKTKNITKFPVVGETIDAAITLNAIGG